MIGLGADMTFAPFVALKTDNSNIYYLTAFFLLSSELMSTLAAIWVAKAAMLNRTQAFSYSGLVVMVY